MSAVMFDIAPSNKAHSDTYENHMSDIRQSRSSHYTSCSCCPYGYHIDLDFVRYCKSLEQDRLQRTGPAGISKRRERRRQRQSMEVLLGLQPNVDSDDTYIKYSLGCLPTQIREEKEDLLHLKTSPEESSSAGVTASRIVEDALQDVVSDFERTLAIQAESDYHKSYQNISSLSSGSGTGDTDGTLRKNVPTLSYNAVVNESRTLAVPDYGDNISSDGSANSGLSTNALQNIREQMALSLERMRDLEDQVKSMNDLQVQLSLLKEENQKLVIRLSKYENKSYFSQQNWSNTLPSQKSRALSWSDHEKRSMKNASVMCSVITRDIGVGHTNPKQGRTCLSPTTESPISQDYKDDHLKLIESNKTFIKAISTDSVLKRDEIEQNNEKQNRIYNGNDFSKDSFSETIIIHNSKNKKYDCSTQTNLQLSDIPFVKPKTTTHVSVGLQTLDQKWSKITIGTQLNPLDLLPLISKRDVAVQILEHSKINVGINTKPSTRDVSIDINPEIIDNISPCKKCKVIKRNIGIGTEISSNNQLVSLSALMGPRSKSFNMGSETLDLGKRTRTTGVQYVAITGINKSAQISPQTTTKYIQYEVPANLFINKGVQINKCHTDTKYTDTCDLIPIKRMSEKSCNTTIKYYKDTGIDVYVQCLECKKRSEEVKSAKEENTDFVCQKCQSTEMITHKTQISEEKSKYTNDAEVNNEKTYIVSSANCPGTPTPSRIPRPSILASTPSEHRKFKRQQTYTKISPGESPQKLSALEHVTATISNSSIDCVTGTHSTIESVVCNVVRPVTDKSETSSKTLQLSHSTHVLENNEDSKSSRSIGNISTDIPENALFLPVSDKPRQKVQPSKEMRAAMKVVNDALQKSNNNVANHLKSANNIIQQEWFKMSSTASANPLDVEDYLDAFEEVSSILLQYIVNMTDNSGNTAMHYAVSHGNFDVVSILLDSKVCNINRPNLAGYTSVMLVSLAEVRSSTHANVVRKLFQLADVNIRAKQHGQTALMLAVSHGRQDMAALLLDAGADVNIQDEDGSTALMCAAEHGHADIVRLFLSQHDCDSTITDVDGSTALKIALEAGHRDIGVLLYAHERMSRGASPYASLRRSRSGRSKTSSPAPPPPPVM